MRYEYIFIYIHDMTQFVDFIYFKTCLFDNKISGTFLPRARKEQVKKTNYFRFVEVSIILVFLK